MPKERRRGVKVNLNLEFHGPITIGSLPPSIDACDPAKYVRPAEAVTDLDTDFEDEVDLRQVDDPMSTQAYPHLGLNGFGMVALVSHPAITPDRIACLVHENVKLCRIADRYEVSIEEIEDCLKYVAAEVVGSFDDGSDR